MSPDKIVELENIWTEFKTSMLAHALTMQCLQTRNLKAIGRTADEAYLSCVTFDQYKHDDSIKKTARSLFNRIIHMAERQFGLPSAPLEINVSQVRSRVFGEDDKEIADKFSPTALWSDLEINYGGNSGQALAYQQTAAKLVTSFQLEKQPPLKIKAGMVVLNKSVWTTKTYRGTNELSHSGAESISALFSALASVAESFEDVVLKWDLQNEASKWHRERAMVSREKRVLDNGKLEYTTFLNYFEFRLSMELAERLQEFLTDHYFSLKAVSSDDLLRAA